MFRVKIALLSVVISGAVLITFSLFFLSISNRVGMERVDREILALGEGQIHVWHPLEHWQEFEKSIRFIYGETGWKNLIVQVTDINHLELYHSPHWPKEIDINLFPEFDNTMETSLHPEGHLHTDRKLFAKDDVSLDLPYYIFRGPSYDNSGILLKERLFDFEKHHHTKNDRFGPPPIPPEPSAALGETKVSYFRSVETESGTWRTAIMGNGYITIMLGLDLAAFQEETKLFQRSVLFMLAIALLLLAGGGWLIAHRALEPVTTIAETTETITAQGLDQRIPSVNADGELLHLINVINNMLDRLEKSFEQAVRFSADTAHELQTPLTILQGHLDEAIQHTVAGSSEQQQYSSLAEEVQRLKSIVRKLLILSCADAGHLQLHLTDVDFSEMISLVMSDITIIAPYLHIEQDLQSAVMVKADVDMLMLVLQNLSSNAVKFNRDNGMIWVALTVQDREVKFTISNTGSLIPEEERDKIFNRFYRLDKSRSQRTPGTGLGLTLAREVSRAHGGDLYLNDSREDVNSFTLSLSC